MCTRNIDGAILVIGTLFQTCPYWRCRNGANLNNKVGGAIELHFKSNSSYMFETIVICSYITHTQCNDVKNRILRCNKELIICV